MQRLLERADFAYVNSDFCADIARAAYQWSPPIIYSVPISDTTGDALPPAIGEQRTGGYVLLANARADKGWYLLLEIAARLPDQSFVAIASQSDASAALVDVAQRGLRNVQILERTDRMRKMASRPGLGISPTHARKSPLSPLSRRNLRCRAT